MNNEQMGIGSPERELESADSQEIKEWRELYEKINVREALEVVKKINDIDFKTTKTNELMEDEDGELADWDGSLSFWGIKRMIMMLFDPDKESNIVYSNLSPEAQSEVLKIDVKKLYKEQ